MMGRSIWLLCLLVVSITQAVCANTQQDVAQDVLNDFARRIFLATKRLWDDYATLYNNVEIIKAKKEILDDIPAFVYEQYISYQEDAIPGSEPCFNSTFNEYLGVHRECMRELGVICKNDTAESNINDTLIYFYGALKRVYDYTLKMKICGGNETCLNRYLFIMLADITSTPIGQKVVDNHAKLLVANRDYRLCLSLKVEECMRAEMNYIDSIINCNGNVTQ